MYGMPPANEDRWPQVFPNLLPQPQPKDGFVLQPPSPIAPEGAEAVQGRIVARIAWLENELRMHEAWKAELALLQRMRDATAPPSSNGEETKR